MRRKKFSTQWKILLGAIAIFSIMSQCDRLRKIMDSGKQIVTHKQMSEADEKAETKEGEVSETKNINVPNGLEIPAKLTDVSEQILVRKAYTVSYNKETKDPNWVAWRLTAEHTEGTVRRPKGAFHEDEEVPEPRATYYDYKKSGWSRGHMCPAGDNKWDEEAMYESFLFTNICPQDFSINSGAWGDIERKCRMWAREYGEVYIACGPIFYNKNQYETIGENKVAVPDAFFKVVLIMEGKPRAYGFICKNGGGKDKANKMPRTVDEVEKITGYDFFPQLPDDIEVAVESKLTD